MQTQTGRRIVNELIRARIQEADRSQALHSRGV
eukprot:SAG31_NODE_46492_length_254_cov_0.670968_1_plen_32_part_10